MRTPNDRIMISECVGVDLFLGGHDHIVSYEKNGSNLAIKSGSDFKEFSLIRLEPFAAEAQIGIELVDKVPYVDADIKPGVEYSAVIGTKFIARVTLFHITHDVPSHPEIAAVIAKSYEEFDIKMKREVCYLDADIDARFSMIRTREMPIGNFLTDLMRKEYNSDCAVLNSGNIRADKVFVAGSNMTLGYWYDTIPFNVMVCLVEMTGEQLIQVLENSVSMVPALAGRFLQVSYIKFTFDITKAAGVRVDRDSVLIGGKPLELLKTYTMACSAFVAAGKDGFDILNHAKMLVPDENAQELKLIITKFFQDSFSSSPDSEINIFRENEKIFTPIVIRERIQEKLNSQHLKIGQAMAVLRRINLL